MWLLITIWVGDVSMAGTRLWRPWCCWTWPKTLPPLADLGTYTCLTSDGDPEGHCVCGYPRHVVKCPQWPLWVPWRMVGWAFPRFIFMWLDLSKCGLSAYCGPPGISMVESGQALPSDMFCSRFLPATLMKMCLSSQQLTQGWGQQLIWLVTWSWVKKILIV